MSEETRPAAPLVVRRRLRQALRDQPLSLREVARQADVSPAYLSRLLNGSRGLPSDERLQRLEKVLGFAKGELFAVGGRADPATRKVLSKPLAVPLMRALKPLTEEDLQKVIELANTLAAKHKEGES